MKRQGVLLVNLGSPDSPSIPEVRRYLREFLMDKRVLDAPFPIRYGIVHACILPFRARHSAEAYRSIWSPEGSPLIVMGRRVQTLLQDRLDLPVELAMRYRNPSIVTAVGALESHGVQEIILIPLFPHYAMSSYETAVERVRDVARATAPDLEITVVAPYFADTHYIEALVASAQPFLNDKFDHLLFSFHGLPERHLRKSDPTGSHCLKVQNCCELESPAHRTCYRAQCFKTVRAFVNRASLPETKFSIAFQSRLGRDPWLQPYTDREIERLARQGIGRLLVICPAFVADCLETLEEIGLRGRATFVENGGKEFVAIPCLNDHPEWVTALTRMIERARRVG